MSSTSARAVAVTARLALEAWLRVTAAVQIAVTDKAASALVTVAAEVAVTASAVVAYWVRTRAAAEVAVITVEELSSETSEDWAEVLAVTAIAAERNCPLLISAAAVAARAREAEATAAILEVAVKAALTATAVEHSACRLEADVMPAVRAVMPVPETAAIEVAGALAAVMFRVADKP